MTASASQCHAVELHIVARASAREAAGVDEVGGRALEGHQHAIYCCEGLDEDWHDSMRLEGVFEEAGVSSPSWQKVYSCYMFKP